MPTYILTTPGSRLSSDQKARAAAGITRVHTEVTGAAGFFAQVIVHEVPAGNYFLGGRPLTGEQLFLHGQIRAGRSVLDRKQLLLALRDVVAEAAGAEPRSVWVYLVDLPACDMVEYGHVLPEPGEEAGLDECPAGGGPRLPAERRGLRAAGEQAARSRPAGDFTRGGKSACTDHGSNAMN